MNTNTGQLASNYPAHPPTALFEAPRRQGTLRPVVPISMKAPQRPAGQSAVEEKQAMRFALTIGTAALFMWGVLLYTIATHLQVPTLW